MRHKRNTQNLSRFSSYFKATVRSLARAVIINRRIITTKVRAKLAKRLVDNLVSLGKDINSLAARRRAFSILCDHSLVHTLFTDIGPSFAQKNGGYTRIIPYKRRRGDNAEMVILELSVQKDVPKLEAEKSPGKKEKAQDKKIKAMATESVRERKAEHRETAAPGEKEKHKKEQQKPLKKPLGGLGKIFKSERDSL